MDRDGVRILPWRTNEELADRVRDVLPDPAVIREQKMFGGLAFMRSGHMFAGILGAELMLRLGESGAGEALARPHVREMTFTGKPMKTMVLVHQDGLVGPALAEWVGEGLAFAESLPPKPSAR